MRAKLELYQYPACSTCRKAVAFLRGKGLQFTSTDLVKDPPTAGQLRALWQASGQPLQALFNVSGESYRAGGFKDRLGAMSDEEKLAALAADGKLVKRPLLAVRDGEGRLVRALVGLREEAWSDALGSLT